MRTALSDDFEKAGEALGLSIPQCFVESREVLSIRLRQIEANPAFQPWSLRAMTIRGSGKMIGQIGFHTLPSAAYLKPFSPDAVEFGFTVFPQYRRQGYAREASIALMEWAHEAHGVNSFILSIRPDNIASQALAAQLGFFRVGSHIDEAEGLEEILLRNT